MSRRGHGSPIRRKLDLDLADPTVAAAVGADQVEYYRERAAWFDDVYENKGDYDVGPERNAAWNDEMQRIEKALTQANLEGACVELGAGTGHWTQFIADTADRVTAVDASEEMLAIARAKLADRDNVEFVIADLWQPEQLWARSEANNSQWNSAAAFFFLEHVPDSVLPGLLTALHASLRPGSPFFVAEGQWSGDEPSVETRTIAHREYRVVERRRSHDEYRAAFDRAGFDVTFGRGGYVIDLVATRR